MKHSNTTNITACSSMKLKFCSGEEAREYTTSALLCSIIFDKVMEQYSVWVYNFI